MKENQSFIGFGLSLFKWSSGKDRQEILVNLMISCVSVLLGTSRFPQHPGSFEEE